MGTFLRHSVEIVLRFWRIGILCCRASVRPKLFELGVRPPGGLFLGVWYAGSIDFWRFRTPNVPILA